VMSEIPPIITYHSFGNAYTFLLKLRKSRDNLAFK